MKRMVWYIRHMLLAIAVVWLAYVFMWITDTNVHMNELASKGEMTSLPYFESLLDRFNSGQQEVEDAFGRNVHYGFWSDPSKADGSVTDFQQAGEDLTGLVVESADIRDGMKVLDVCCGFGGTIFHLDQRFNKMDLVGLNLDQKQLDRARREHAKDTKIEGNSSSNHIRFVHGNACELPFEDNSFDAILAVECIFHFPDRNEFLKEARRVLRDGGHLGLSDLLIPEKDLPFAELARSLLFPVLGVVAGPIHQAKETEYTSMAASNGLAPKTSIDITLNTIPTYEIFKIIDFDVDSIPLHPVLINKKWLRAVNSMVIDSMAAVQRRGLIEYKVLSFQ